MNELLVGGIGPHYTAIADGVREAMGAQELHVATKTFKDGERYHKLVSEVAGHDVLLVCGTHNDAQTLDLFDVGCVTAKSGAHSLSIFIPYYGYSTMEEAKEPREVIKAKTRARLLSAIPRAGSGNRLFFFDLHVEGTANYTVGDEATLPVCGEDLIADAIEKHFPPGAIIASADSGRVKRVQRLGRRLNRRVVFGVKERDENNEPHLLDATAGVAGRDVVIYDDIWRSGSTIFEASAGFRRMGAISVSVITSHGLFLEESLQRALGEGAVDKVISTDSHPGSAKCLENYIVLPIKDLIAKSIKPYLYTRTPLMSE